MMFQKSQFLDSTNSFEESNNSQNYKYVEYDFIEKKQDPPQYGGSKSNSSLDLLQSKQVIPILRPMAFHVNKYLLGNDLYMNLDFILYKSDYEVSQSILREFKNVTQVEWNQKQQYLRLQLDTTQPYTYDFSLMLYQLSTLQNSKYSACIKPLKQYESYCKLQYEMYEMMSKSSSDYQSRAVRHIKEQNEAILNSLIFSNKYIFILERGYDTANNQFSLQATCYSEKLLDLLGIFHGLNMFGFDRSELTSMLCRLGAINIFDDVSSMERTMSYFLYQNQRQEEIDSNSEMQFDFYTLDNIRVQCKGKRIQYNANLDLDQQLNTSHKELLSTSLQIIFELNIQPELIAQINNQRTHQLKYFSKLTDKLTREEAKQYCLNGQYPDDCKSFLQKYYKDVLNREIKNIHSNFYDLSWLNHF